VRDVVKVLDFGISKIRGAKTVLTQDAALLGTPQYMAPEQATGRNDEIDARTDVFAFGAMTFEMLAGRAPFTGDTLASVIHAIVYTPTPSLAALTKDTPPAIVAAIERAMEKNRDARFPDVNSFVKAVTSRSLATAPGTEHVQVPQVQARQPTIAATERIDRERSSVRTYFIMIGVAVAAVAGFMVYRGSLEKQREKALDVAVPTTTAAPTTPPPTTIPPTPTAKPPANTDTDTDAPTPTATAKPTAEAKPTSPKKPSAGNAKETALSPEAARDLDDAESALAAGKAAEALRLAQHSLYAQKSSRAYALITRARCAQGDLGNAKAALAQVSARDRSSVVRACGKLGVELH